MLGQITACGLGERAVQKRVAAGRFQRWADRVYILGPGALSADGERMAATLAAGRDAWLSHRSAAVAWGLLAHEPPRPHVTVVGDSRQHARAVVHGVRRLERADTTTLRGVPITTPARTVVDCADDPLLERIFNEAQVLRLADPRAVREALDRVRGRRGTGPLRSLLHDADIGVSRSDLEDLFAAVARPVLRSPWVRNHVIDLGDRRITVDVYFPAERVVVELDGARYHRTRRAFERDRERDAALAAQGILSVRLTWRRLAHEGPAAMDELQRTLAARAA
jgi:hypothetical protein